MWYFLLSLIFILIIFFIIKISISVIEDLKNELTLVQKENIELLKQIHNSNVESTIVVNKIKQNK